MPSFATASCEGSRNASHGDIDDGSRANSRITAHDTPLRPARSHSRSPQGSRSRGPFLKVQKGRGAGKEKRPPLLPKAQEFDDHCHGRKSTSSSFVSIANGRVSAAPPTTDCTKKRDSKSGLPPALTREEFEALPLAIQRKYFSTLERLRFAQSSSGVDGIFQHYCETSKRRGSQHVRLAPDSHSRRIRRRSLQNSPSLDSDSLSFATNLSDKIRRRQLTREEQVALARHLRASVILDAADEAIYRINRRASASFTSDYGSLVSSESRVSMDSQSCNSYGPSNRATPSPRLGEPQSPVPASFYDSFRWLEDDEDLDLRLFLDDYHANLRETLPTPAKEQHQPSFRRHMSITKIPFGRSSLSSSRPGTKDANSPTSPLHSPTKPPSNGMPGARRRSRTLSLIAAKQVPPDPAPPIDPAAAHYQDPEARLKLRVYLASPQKFDEAIEFGFPAAEVLGASPVIQKGSVSPPRSQSRQQQQRRVDGPPKIETFLADGDDDDSDDKLSYSDQISAADPDSPQTPLSSMDKPTIRPARLPTGPSSEGYVQLPASSREMTLRMTLTRPDLRATEDQIYGWKQPPSHQVRKSQSTTMREDVYPALMAGDSAHKESMERHLGSIDHWGPPTDQNVMKRIWNRVRRS